MAEITASMVKELREATGLGMMECKKALAEAGGDMKAADDLLRIKSGAKASKAAGRIAAEGVVGAWIAANGQAGALVEVNCETDFVAQRWTSSPFAKSSPQLVGEKNPHDLTVLAELPLDGTTVEAARQALVQKIGENIGVRRFVRFATGARLPITCTAPASACWSTTRGATSNSARISPCTSPRASRWRCRRKRSPVHCSKRSGRSHGAGGGKR